MVLDLRAIEEAEQNLDRGRVTRYDGPWPRHVICGRISPWKSQACGSNATHWVTWPFRLLRIGGRKLSALSKTTRLVAYVLAGVRLHPSSG